MKLKITKLMTLAALALGLSPTMALAHPIQNTGAHLRPVLLHDRSPKLHLHAALAHH